jgi:hypothetical protein
MDAMNQTRSAAVATVGALAGAVLGVCVVAAFHHALSYHPQRDGWGLLLLAGGIGGLAGAVLGMSAGTVELRGRGKTTALGALAGCGLGVLGAVLYASIAVSHKDPGGIRDAIEVGYRWQGLSIGVPAGSLFGGIVGFVAGFVRRRVAPLSAQGGSCRHDER